MQEMEIGLAYFVSASPGSASNPIYLEQKRLDRALVNDTCYLMFPETILFHKVAIGSDHCPILLDTYPNHNSMPKPFKFQSMWINHPTYNDTIKTAWTSSTTQHNSTHLPISQQLSKTKRVLKIWNKSTFGNIFHQISNLKLDIAYIQSEPHSSMNSFLETRATNPLDSLLEYEEQLWKQKSRGIYVKEGDRNTKYFHIMTLRNRKFNKIEWLRKEDNSWLQTPRLIGEAFVGHFTKFLTEPSQVNLTQLRDLFPNLIPPDDMLHLRSPIIEKEIKSITFSIGSRKAPEPDGFPALFYQSSWATVDKDICAMVSNFFENGHSLADINHTNVALIPKIQNPEKCQDFRPISLCNITYKII
ncbi:hypothetical protein IFM89_038686 [Coptis chinensis]|uniref:Uncharacterized protein n=1 Tax=Coptis chinensis TaxID=261450 RepID=A0A835LU12_9MAGN|nr:hypothetical protein IFM89_038686 [Coptis chinensis]